jgi:uncharacterized membrane protein YhfC
MDTAQEVYFSDSTLLGYGITGAVYIMLPVLAFYIMHRYNAARLWHVIVGVVTYFISTRLSDACVLLTLSSASAAQKQVAAAELVGVFEETGRFLAMRFALSDIHSPRGAVCYGIGHAGLECWIRGVQRFQLIGYGREIDRVGIAEFLSGVTPERAAELTEVYRRYAEKNIFFSFLDQLTAVTGFGVHIALSLLIYKKLIADHPRFRWLAAAIGLHYALNAVSYVASLSGSLLLTGLAVLACGVGIIALVYRLINGREVADEILYPEL